MNLQTPDINVLLEKWKQVLRDTDHIWTWTSQRELAWIAEYASRSTLYLEIGSYNGRSAKVAMLANPSLRMICLDTWDDGNLPTFQANLATEIKDSRLIFVQGSSQQTIKKVYTVGLDACFIDGGHEEHLVIADINNVLPRMKKGSLMAGHDFYPKENNDVSRGVLSLITNPGNPTDSIWTHQI